MDKRYVKVLIVLRDTTLEALGLKKGQGYEDRHFVKKDKKGNSVFESRVRIECEIGEDSILNNRINEDLYPIGHDITPSGRYFYEVQLTEGSAPNTSVIITGDKGEKLEPRWTNKSVGGFRTTKGTLLAIEYAGLRRLGTISRYSLVPEGNVFYLRKERVAEFTINGTETEGGEERPLIKWSKIPFEVGDVEADANFAKAIQAAIDRSSHNCFHPKHGCDYPHYAFSVEEIKARRAEARVAREAERKEGKTVKAVTA